MKLGAEAKRERAQGHLIHPQTWRAPEASEDSWCQDGPGPWRLGEALLRLGLQTARHPHLKPNLAGPGPLRPAGPRINRRLAAPSFLPTHHLTPGRASPGALTHPLHRSNTR